MFPGLDFLTFGSYHLPSLQGSLETNQHGSQRLRCIATIRARLFRPTEIRAALWATGPRYQMVEE